MWGQGRDDVRVPRFFLTALAGVRAAVILQQLALARNDLDLLGDEFLPNHHKLSAALVAEKLILRQGDQDFFHRQVCRQFVHGTFRLSGWAATEIVSSVGSEALWSCSTSLH